MKKTSAVLVAAAALLAAAGGAQAQMGPTTPFALELRGGLAFPTGDFGDGLENGWTAGLNGSFNFTPILGVYAGYTFNSFGVDEDEAGIEDVSVNDKGFDAGLRASFAGMGGFTPFLKGGLVFHEIEFDVDGESVSTDSHLGFEIGGGVEIPLGPRMSFTPGVSFTSYSLDDDELEEELDVTHIKVDVGLRVRI